MGQESAWGVRAHRMGPQFLDGGLIPGFGLGSATLHPWGNQASAVAGNPVQVVRVGVAGSPDELVAEFEFPGPAVPRQARDGPIASEH
jgi:hypothetical protein